MHKSIKIRNAIVAAETQMKAAGVHPADAHTIAASLARNVTSICEQAEGDRAAARIASIGRKRVQLRTV